LVIVFRAYKVFVEGKIIADDSNDIYYGIILYDDYIRKTYWIWAFSIYFILIIINLYENN